MAKPPVTIGAVALMVMVAVEASMVFAPESVIAIVPMICGFAELLVIPPLARLMRLPFRVKAPAPGVKTMPFTVVPIGLSLFGVSLKAVVNEMGVSKEGSVSKSQLVAVVQFTDAPTPKLPSQT